MEALPEEANRSRIGPRTYRTRTSQAVPPRAVEMVDRRDVVPTGCQSRRIRLEWCLQSSSSSRFPFNSIKPARILLALVRKQFDLDQLTSDWNQLSHSRVVARSLLPLFPPAGGKKSINARQESNYRIRACEVNIPIHPNVDIDQSPEFALNKHLFSAHITASRAHAEGSKCSSQKVCD